MERVLRRVHVFRENTDSTFGHGLGSVLVVCSIPSQAKPLMIESGFADLASLLWRDQPSAESLTGMTYASQSSPMSSDTAE
jgi:hypothetical protein